MVARWSTKSARHALAGKMDAGLAGEWWGRCRLSRAGRWSSWRHDRRQAIPATTTSAAIGNWNHVTDRNWEGRDHRCRVNARCTWRPDKSWPRSSAGPSHLHESPGAAWTAARRRQRTGHDRHRRVSGGKGRRLLVWVWDGSRSVVMALRTNRLATTATSSWTIYRWSWQLFSSKHSTKPM